MRKSRFLSAVFMCGLMVGGLAQPAFAGGEAATIWFVDDDGMVGARGCNGDIVAPSVIQGCGGRGVTR